MESQISTEKVVAILADHDELVLPERIGFYTSLAGMVEKVRSSKYWSMGEVFVCALDAKRFVIMKQIAPSSCEMMTITQNGFHDVLTANEYSESELMAVLQNFLGISPEFPASDTASVKKDYNAKDLWINVRQLVSDECLGSPADKGQAGVYAVHFGSNAMEMSVSQRASMALVISQAYLAINCLSDFAIEVVDAEAGVVVYPNDGHETLAASVLGKIEKVSPIAFSLPKTVYLAGPDVFKRDVASHASRLKTLCAAEGMVGLFPLDNDLSMSDSTAESLPVRIAEANEALIRQADVVLANLSAFRGAEPDSGTVCEVVFASMLGKPVYAYMDDAAQDMVSRVARHYGEVAIFDGVPCDADRSFIENFGDPLNLMVRRHVTFSASRPDECLTRLKAVHRFLRS